MKKLSVSNLVANPIRKSIECPSLFSPQSEEILDALPFEWPPPKTIPDAMRHDYTLGNRVEIGAWYFTQRYAGGEARENVWTVQRVDDMLAGLKRRDLGANYGQTATNIFHDVVTNQSHFMKGAHVLVVGSENPWVEAICLAAGAAKVTTLEYGRIKSLHPQIATMTPAEFNAKYRSGELPSFDVAVSYSSLEHSGLGRYGDGLNPWGDIITSARLSCVVKKGGHLILGLPGNEDKDMIVYNAHRVYGPKRWALMLTNWLPLSMISDTVHLVAVAQNERN